MLSEYSYIEIDSFGGGNVYAIQKTKQNYRSYDIIRGTVYPVPGPVDIKPPLSGGQGTTISRPTSVIYRRRVNLDRTGGDGRTNRFFFLALRSKQRVLFTTVFFVAGKSSAGMSKNTLEAVSPWADRFGGVYY